jgi:hypothetical protein
MTRHREPTDALALYVDALVGIGGQLTSILQHMYAHRSPASAGEPAEIFARLIADVMPARVARRDVDLKIAAQVLNATSKAIENELFLVNDEGAFDDVKVNGTERLH